MSTFKVSSFTWGQAARRVVQVKGKIRALLCHREFAWHAARVRSFTFGQYAPFAGMGNCATNAHSINLLTGLAGESPERETALKVSDREPAT